MSTSTSNLFCLFPHTHNVVELCPLRTLIVGFNIDNEGTVEDIKIVDSISKDVDKQVLAAFDGMPKWTPAIKNGEKVDSEYRLPFYFQKES